MKTTENYGLCQWEETDLVRRTDFNGDNAKLDAALARLEELNPMKKLMTVKLAAAVNQVDLDVSGIDLTGYVDLIFYFMTKDYQFYVRVNGGTGNLFSSNYSNSYWSAYKASVKGVQKSGCGALFFLQCNSETHYTGSYSETQFTVQNGEKINTFNVVTGNSAYLFPVGTEIRLYGVRA